MSSIKPGDIVFCLMGHIPYDKHLGVISLDSLHIYECTVLEVNKSHTQDYAMIQNNFWPKMLPCKVNLYECFLKKKDLKNKISNQI